MKKHTLSLMILLLCLGMTELAVAQKHRSSEQQKWTTHYLVQRKAVSNFERIELGAAYTVKDIEQHLLKNISHVASEQASLELLDQNESPVGQHFTFQQLYQDIPIYSAKVRVHVNQKGTIVSVIGSTLATEALEKTPLSKSLKSYLRSKVAKKYTAENKLTTSEIAPNLVWVFESADKAVLGTKITASNKSKQSFGEHIVDEAGKLLYFRNLQTYYHSNHDHNKQSKTTKKRQEKIGEEQQAKVEAEALVFMPDPITSSGKSYGDNGQYIDSEDADRAELNAERTRVKIEVKQSGGRYLLENSYVKITDFDAPFIDPVTPATPVFNYTRSQSGFEDVNTYYHVNEFREYIQGLQQGDRTFESLVNERIDIDTHALSGDDNSYYTFSGGRHQLRFGEGGVDDAEDADVVVHEYCHAISNTACRDCNFGFERNALDEALADYLATSYSRNIKEYNWGNMFSWDGHNIFFDGRNVDNEKRYPEDLLADYHLTGEIWAGALMDVWEELGREVTDMLVLASTYSYSSNIGLEDAANILIVMDQELWAGKNNGILSSIMAARGLIPYVVNAGVDQAACIGEGITLGDPSVGSYLNATVYWSPGISLNDSTLVAPVATPDEPTEYVLTVVDNATQTSYQDQVFIDAKYCFPTDPTELQLVNTDRFMKGRGNVIIEIPGGEDLATTVQMFDATGRIVSDGMVTGENRIELNGDGLAPGLYLIYVKVGENEEVFKVVRTR